MLRKPFFYVTKEDFHADAAWHGRNEQKLTPSPSLYAKRGEKRIPGDEEMIVPSLDKEGLGEFEKNFKEYNAIV